LKSVQRLSIFEEICPSEEPQSEQKAKFELFSTCFGASDDIEETKEDELALSGERSGLSIEFEQKSVEPNKKLDSVPQARRRISGPQ